MLPPHPFPPQNLNGPTTFAVTRMYYVTTTYIVPVSSTYTAPVPVSTTYTEPGSTTYVVPHYYPPAVPTPGPPVSPVRPPSKRTPTARVNSQAASGRSPARFSPYRKPTTPPKVTPPTDRQLAPRYVAALAAAEAGSSERFQRYYMIPSPPKTPELTISDVSVLPSPEPIDSSPLPPLEPAINLSVSQPDEERQSTPPFVEPVPMSLTPPSSPRSSSPLTAPESTPATESSVPVVSAEVHSELEGPEMIESPAEQTEPVASSEILTSGPLTSEEAMMFDMLIDENIFL